MLSLFVAEFKRSLLEFIRYPGEVIVSIIILVIMFYGLFLGTSYIAGPEVDFGERLDSIIVGYVVWTMALHSLTSVANEMQKEAQTGALQQVFLSAYGPTRVFILRTISEIILTSIITITILFVILLLTGRRLEFSPALIGPIVSILLGSFGLAFLMGALALWLKRVQQLLNLGQFVLLFLIMVPFEKMEGLWSTMQYVLPMVPGTGLLRSAMARGEVLDWNVLMLAYVNGFVYTALGLTVFAFTVTRVKKSGSLGWY